MTCAMHHLFWCLDQGQDKAWLVLNTPNCHQPAQK